MDIPSTDTSSKAWPKVVSDYAGALVRLAAARIEGQQHLLFAYVELFPHDIPLPASFKSGQKPWPVPDFGGQTTLTVGADRKLGHF